MRLSDKLQDFLVNGPNMWGPQYETIQQAYRLAKRYEDAATGECVEAGSMPGLEGDPFVGIIIESTPDELKKGPAIVYKRVRIVLDKEG